MLQAQELRFGNKVYNQTGEIITVQQILYNTVIYGTQMKINKEMTYISGSYEISYITEVVEVIEEADYQELEPIILTSGLLQKCGFRYFVREDWIISYQNTHADFEFTDEGLRLKHPTSCRRTIKYLHQLQNFFFALTGHELEVNL